MGKTFSSAEDRVDEDDFEAMLPVLGGRSTWRGFLRPACAEARKNLPARPFRVLPQAEYKTELARLDSKADPNTTPGITDKREGVIFMQGYFGVKSREAMLGHSLHETVHLVSHRPGKAGQTHSTAIGFLGEGMLEGLVELITTDILTSQQITLASPGKRGHQQRVPVVEELMRFLGIGPAILGALLFKGDFDLFHRIVTAAFGTPGWLELQRLATADNPAQARRRMGELRAAEERQHPGALRKVMQPAAPITTPAPVQPQSYGRHYGMSPPPPVRD